MKAMREWGYDLFSVSLDINQVIQASKLYDLRLFDVYLHEDDVLFYAPVIDRRKVMHAFPYARHEKTTGVLGFLLFQLRKPRRLLGILTSIIVIVIASNTVFAIEIRGSSQILEGKIATYLESIDFTVPRKKLSLSEFQEMEQKLKENFFAEIEWINLSRIGSSYFIDYVERIQKYPEPKFTDPLIAHKSGVIARFDLKRGVKMVKEFDFVREGDILVTSEVQATDNVTYETYVEGKVYAYTQHILNVNMKPNALTKLHPGFGFFQLLFDCRNQIASQLQNDESIVKENILLFDHKPGRIEMKIHYTLYEDITHP